MSEREFIRANGGGRLPRADTDSPAQMNEPMRVHEYRDTRPVLPAAFTPGHRLPLFHISPICYVYIFRPTTGPPPLSRRVTNAICEILQITSYELLILINATLLAQLSGVFFFFFLFGKVKFYE